MRVLWVIIVFLAYSINLIGQQKLPNNNFTGILKDTGNNGIIYSEIPYTNGKKNGVEKEYDVNGTLTKETAYKDGLLNGIKKRYYPNKKIYYEASYVNNKMDGVEKEYYVETGTVERETTYKEGKRNGFFKWYYHDGNLFIERYYNNNIQVDYRDTSDRVYFENGKLNHICFTDSAKREVLEEFYGNGAVKYVTVPYDSVMANVMKQYYDNGNLQKEVTTKNKIRIAKEYDRTGKLTKQTIDSNYTLKWKAPIVMPEY